jgi:RNA polymerase sigma-70 factor, ECF subfamily
MKMTRSPDIAFPGVVSTQSEQDDVQLVGASQRGNQDAFALLVRRHQRRIFTLVFRMLQDYEETSECTQDVFVAAWQGLPGFHVEARFSTWLYRIAYQCCLRQLGRRKLEHARHSAGQAEQAPVGIRPEKQGAETTRRHDRQTFVEEQLEHLPLTYRTVLILRHLHDQTYEEIANITSMPLGTVKTRLFRARALLKERYPAPLATRETMVETPLTENEEVMHTSGPFHVLGRGLDSMPDKQETGGFSQHQQAWLEQQQGWVEQQRSALAQQEAWVEQRPGWAEQQ